MDVPSGPTDGARHGERRQPRPGGLDGPSDPDAPDDPSGPDLPDGASAPDDPDGPDLPDGAVAADAPIGAADGGDAAHRGRYGWVLLLVLGAIVVPLSVPDGLPGTLTTVAFQAAALAAGVWAAGATRPQRRFATLGGATATGGAVALGVAMVTLAAPTRDLAAADAAARWMAILLGVLVPVVILRDLARHRQITVDTVAGALCVYLLLGIAFAWCHVTVDRLAAGYSQPLTEADAMYLSFVTLTTVGFGDLTPVSGAARAVTVTQAIVGQLYLVSVIAVIVGHLGQWRRPR